MQPVPRAGKQSRGWENIQPVLREEKHVTNAKGGQTCNGAKGGRENM